MWMRALPLGMLLWLAGTVLIRLGGQHLLLPEHIPQTVLLYAISFVLMAWLVPRMCHRLGLAHDLWPRAATLIVLPTLILDPFACAFFATVYPNIEPAAAGAFGGWMLICCGGALAGIWRKS